ncbi:hypothetical protein ICHIJ1_04580 [Fluviibacter phosphoraccumulans]|uniref:Uncharacterized protein n=1 Tax=Fluviibacter phosphoraccumulans TaxID=1751046 RepID=A0A7R6QV74_9RHOO|nr:hypothetical protein ICHIAU1_02050 [Fluviibacter phosphoraccumulans]BBU70539.1 hypothetical protein ICHIJ1_04580 [Fluviibacter phosphoraccumulans]
MPTQGCAATTPNACADDRTCGAAHAVANGRTRTTTDSATNYGTGFTFAFGRYCGTRGTTNRTANDGAGTATNGAAQSRATRTTKRAAQTALEITIGHRHR